MKTLGKYHILGTLGKGGFATVYKAKDPDLDRQVALKVMEPLLMRDPVWVRRFRHEARAIAQLKHPHIITIYEIGQADGILFIAMELAEDGSLEARLEEGSLSWTRTLELAQQIAAALDHAHARGIIHRDLKPANILLDPNVGAILTDFGFARLVADHSLSVTMSGGMVGTPSYIPPEVWKGQRAGKPADIYAFGAILYEMITGQKRFDAPSPPAVMMAHFSPPPWPDAWPEDAPPGVVDVLARAMAADPEIRYDSANEFIAELLMLADDKLAAPYEKLRYAIRLKQWEEAARLAQAIEQQNKRYKDTPYLLKKAIAGMEAQAVLIQVNQWRQTAQTAFEQENLMVAEAALSQWLSLAPEDEEAMALKQRLEERQKPSAPEPEPTPHQDHTVEDNDIKSHSEEHPVKPSSSPSYSDDSESQRIQSIKKQAQNLFQTGLKHLQHKTYPEAIEAFSQAIELLPDQPEYYFYRSISLYNAAYLGIPDGSYEKARADYDAVQALAPDNARYDFSQYVFHLIRSQ